MTFEEILEVIEFEIEKQKEEQMLRAYEITYSAIKGISYIDFKNQIINSTGTEDASQIETDVESILNTYKWEVI